MTILHATSAVAQPFLTLLLMLLLATSPTAKAATAEKLLAGADYKAGAMLHKEKNCAACHAQLQGGDGSTMYSRSNRKITDPSGLLTQIAACNTRLRIALFPEDERDIAAFLNKDFYRFK